MRPARRVASACLLLVPVFCGCGGKHDTHRVTGKVALTDGTPLADVRVTFESQEAAISATAVTDEDGTYRLGTVKEGDGAPAGAYRVAVVELPGDDPDHPSPPRIHRKYGSFKTSGLKFTVERGRNSYDIELNSPDSRGTPD
ncbi:MAG: carboxypeptidase-like regulatory domain-containing protein [Planctomycetota bacterium]